MILFGKKSMSIAQAEGNLRELGVYLVESLIVYPKYQETIGYEVRIISIHLPSKTMRSKKRQRLFEKALKFCVNTLKSRANAGNTEKIGGK